MAGAFGGVRIGIVGDGVVGGALRAWFEASGADARSYDPPKGLRDQSAIERADVVFVCVPTPYAPRLGFDPRYLMDAVSAIGGGKLVVIKSTVRPGTTDRLQRQFPQHRFMFNPEFLREATAVADMRSPNRQIVGCTEQSAAEAELVLGLLPAAPLSCVCGAREAEMTKYVANSFLAVKVSYFNEVYDVCQRMGIDFELVRDLAVADPRIGRSHSDVLDGGYRGYGGKCLPKDSKALIDLAEDAEAGMLVLRAADAVNAALVGQKQPDAPPARVASEMDEPAAAAWRSDTGRQAA
ncbi:MAG TPA: hypothetical protein VEZ14_06980 [Dehalococcoidia bacterium]|nr:hypothetical protein [Dehalococcoidia bacterium]